MKVVQILGLFNSGTNLLFQIINTLFDVQIGDEGHTLFWKHTVLTDEFSKKYVKKKNTNVYIVVSKNPYFQFHSFKKAPYSIRLRNNTNNTIDNFVQKSFYIVLPRNVITDSSQLSFKHFPHYWNEFHSATFKYLPQHNTLYVKYEDIVFNTDQVITQLSTILPLKPQFIDNNTLIRSTLNIILDTPAKKSGNPRFGNSARQYYTQSNINTLYKPNTFTWINRELKKQIMNRLNYTFHIAP